MSNEVDSYSLPISSSDLCFDGNAFIQPYFSADRFLQEHRGRASLETMRDDLGSYLKVLRSATLDLIDHEYADFVGLSSSLVGLDKAVGKIRDPLGQLREEVMTVKSSLEEAVKGVKMQLEVRRNLIEQRGKLEASLQALRSLQRLESLLGVETQLWQNLNEMNQKLPIAERAAAECNHLHFCLERCDSVDQLKLHAQSIRSQLLKMLEVMLLLLSSTQSAEVEGDDGTATFGNRHALTRLLCTYASLNETCTAEQLIGEHVVAPALDAIVKASIAKGSGPSSNLSEIYGNVLSIVDQELGRLLDLTANGARNSHVEGFDFLAHSFWPQFVKKLELNLPNIFAPGNPDVFHQRFSETMEFLERLEKHCGSRVAVERLRSQPSYQHFLNSWNLPVYFQIRFQEVAGFLEAAFPLPPSASSSIESAMGLGGPRPSHGGFWLLQTSACWDCILRCWDSSTFISQIGHRFWKMSLQFIARYCRWSRDVLEHQLGSVKHMLPPHYQPKKDQAPSTAGGETADEPGTEQGSSWTEQGPWVSLPWALLLPLCLHRDAYLLSMRLQQTLMPMATSALTMATGVSGKQRDIDGILQRSLDDGLQALSNLAPLASRCIVHIISQGSLPHLQQCRDIPRFYRRTNRTHPTRPRPYVSAALSIPLRFRSLILTSYTPPSPAESAAWVNPGLCTNWMQEIFSEITLQYYVGVSEVLTSVHKMEESLRRLKRIKGRATLDAVPTGESPSTDDDDKIRAQLALDVHNFCQQIESTGVHKEQVKQLIGLVELVDNAINKVNMRTRQYVQQE